MNADQYLREHADLVSRVLLQQPFQRDWRVYLAGALCIVFAVALEVWAAKALIDPGYFARASTFAALLLTAGVWLLTSAMGTDVLIARTAIPSRNVLIERTLGQLIKSDVTLAQGLVQRS